MRTAAQLREMCEGRGIACSGLKKAQMIELLEKYDDECLPEESNREDRTPEDREDDGKHEGGDDDYESVDDSDRYSSRGAAGPSGGPPQSEGAESNETLHLCLAIPDGARAVPPSFSILLP